MSELGSANIAGDTAKLRREQRRRKLLMTSEERMRKIMGVSQNYEESKDTALTSSDATGHTRRPSESVETNLDQSTSVSASRGCQSALTEDTAVFSSHQTGGMFLQGDTNIRNRKIEHQVTPPLADVTTSVTGSDPMRVESSTAAAPMKPRRTSQHAESSTPAPSMRPSTSQQAFCRFRTMFVLLVGFLVRVAFLYDVGQLYVQTIVNPFVALEISLLGFQKSAGMDLGGSTNEGVISALVLLGVRPRIINIVKQALGAATNIGLDFAFYFFAFVITHVLI